MLMAADRLCWWLLKAGLAMVISLRQCSLLAWLFFHKCFFSVQCWLIAFYIFQNWSQWFPSLLLLLSIKFLLYSKSFVISNNLHSIVTRSSFALKKPFIHPWEAAAHPFKFYHEMQPFSPIFSSTCSCLAISTTSAVPSSTEILTSLSHLWGLESASSILLLMPIFWPLTMHESWMFLMASTMMNSCQRVFNLLYLGQSDSCLLAVITLWNVFLKKNRKLKWLLDPWACTIDVSRHENNMNLVCFHQALGWPGTLSVSPSTLRRVFFFLNSTS